MGAQEEEEEGEENSPFWLKMDLLDWVFVAFYYFYFFKTEVWIWICSEEELRKNLDPPLF